MDRKASESPHVPGGKVSCPNQMPQNLLSCRQPTQVPKPRHELLERDSFEAKKIASDTSVTLAECNGYITAMRSEYEAETTSLMQQLWSSEVPSSRN
jgi:hypothetical protein